MARVFIAFIGCCVIGLVMAGCQKNGGSQPNEGPALPTVASEHIDPILLQADVNAFAFTFRSRVSGTASEVARATSDRVVREAATRWKIQVIPAVESARLASDPRAAFAGIWAICVRQRSLFAGDFGQENFGDQAETVRSVVVDLEKQVVEIASKYLPPEHVAAVAEEMEHLAAEASVIGDFNLAALRARTGVKGDSDPIGRVLRLPMSTVGAIGDTPAEIRNIANVVAGFGETTRALPEHTRWQLELLLLDTEEHPVFADLHRASEATATVAGSIEAFQKSLERADGPLTALGQTMADAKVTAEHVDATAARAAEVVASIDGHAAALSDMASSFESTVTAADGLLQTWQEMNPPKPAPPPGAAPAPEAPPFDIKDAVAVADQTRAAIIEARGLLTDLQDPALKERLELVKSAGTESVDHAAARLDSAITRLTWSLAIVLALAILASAGARLVVHRLTRPGAAGR
jgi:hypothetical protein